MDNIAAMALPKMFPALLSNIFWPIVQSYNQTNEIVTRMETAPHGMGGRRHIPER